MAGYAVVEVTIHDAILYEKYRQLTPATVAAFKGKFIVRGGESTSLEGSWQPQRLVIIEFPTVEMAKAWWNSPEYTHARSIRQAAATTKLLVIEGA